MYAWPAQESNTLPTRRPTSSLVAAFLPEPTPLRISSVLLGSSAGSPMPGLLRRVRHCPYALPPSSLQPPYCTNHVESLTYWLTHAYLRPCLPIPIPLTP